MKIQLSDHFTYGRLLRFTLPSIVMMIFTSIYGVVDGFFISNYVGKTPFAAVNFIMPFLMILGALGFMFGTGGSALVAMTVGEGDRERANRIFSLLIYVSLACGVCIAILGVLFVRPVAALLGAEGMLLENCVLYGRIILAAIPAFMLQMEFQSFFVAAEKPQLGLMVTVASGVANMVLDALFVAGFRWGIPGAAAATAVSQVVGGVIPLIYFLRPNHSLLQLTKTKFDGRVLLKTCTNGSSELMSNISMSLVGMLYNVQLMKYTGEDGVAAYGVLMYVSMIFMAAFIGYSVGAAPVVSYHYGAGNKGELRGLLRRSLVLVGLFSGASGADTAGICDLFLRLPVRRAGHIWFFLFHCVEQRADLRTDFLPADAGVPDCRGADLPGHLGCGRNLVFHCGGGADGGVGDCPFSVGNAEEISLWQRVTVPGSCGQQGMAEAVFVVYFLGFV